MNIDERKDEEMTPTRRAFLGTAAAAAVSAATLGGEGHASAEEAAGAPVAAAGEYDPAKHRYVYLVDTTKCIGCGSCVRACEVENEVPPHYFRTWVERYMVSRTGETFVDSPNGARDGFGHEETGADITKAFFVPKICNHCTNSPCVQLCPVGASFRSPDGVVLVDEKRCIGCGYCIQACPYGSRFFHPVLHVASKCTLCYHRLAKGMTTACVQACPVQARRLGDAAQPGDEVSNIVATQPVHVLKPELLTEPNCYYAGSSMEVR